MALSRRTRTNAASSSSTKLFRRPPPRPAVHGVVEIDRYTSHSHTSLPVLQARNVRTRHERLSLPRRLGTRDKGARLVEPVVVVADGERRRVVGPQQLDISRPRAAGHAEGDGARRGLPTRGAALVPQRVAEEPSRTLVD
eukprot:scaffold66391_cov60-Phaeocystis_antarctica.AAC.1